MTTPNAPTREDVERLVTLWNEASSAEILDATGGGMVEALRALLDENERLRGRLNGWESHCSHIIAENDALRKDKDLLLQQFEAITWMLGNGGVVTRFDRTRPDLVLYGNDREWACMVRNNPHWYFGRTMLDAINAAREGA